MTLRLFALILLLLAACAPARPYRPAPESYGTSSGSAASETLSRPPAPAPANSYSQDAVECERKAAFAGIGSKGEAFASCMRARGHAPGR